MYNYKTLTMSKVMDGFIKGIYTRDEVLDFGYYHGYTGIEMDYFMDVDHINFADDVIGIMMDAIDSYGCENYDEFYEHAFIKTEKMDPVRLCVNGLKDSSVDYYFTKYGITAIYDDLRTMPAKSKIVKNPRDILFTLMHKTIADYGEYLFNMTQKYYDYL